MKTIVELPPYRKVPYDFLSIRPGKVFSKEELCQLLGVLDPECDVPTYRTWQFAKMEFGETIAASVDFPCFIKYDGETIRVTNSEETSIVGESRLNKHQRKLVKTLATMKQVDLAALTNERRVRHEKVVLQYQRLMHAADQHQKRISGASRAG